VGPLVVEWAARWLGLELLGFQVHALEGALELDEAGELAHRTAYVSVARQNGKTVLGRALLGWWVTDYARMRGRAQVAVNLADELSLASQQFEALAPILEAQFGWKLKNGYGRMEGKGPDGSRWYVKSDQPAAPHGLSCDLVWADEIWNMSSEVLSSGWRQTMKARNPRTAGGWPLMFMTSTAGTQASVAQIRYREQGLQIIDSGNPGRFYMAEWSVDPGVDPMDMTHWGQANPGLGTVVELETLVTDSQDPDRISFLRGGLNLFVDADAAWLQPGEWETCRVEDPFPEDQPKWVTVDLSLDDSRWIGVEAAAHPDGRVHVRPAFAVATLAECLAAITRVCEHPGTRLAVCPALDGHVPVHLAKRKRTVGYGELLEWTGLAYSLIKEQRLVHNGESTLAEHMNRAVAVKQNHALALSSKRSPGPIELARLTVFAAGLASRPRAVGRAAMGTSR